MRILIDKISSPGGRANNEDYCAFAQDERVCMALADGLGGHSGGEVASHTAVEGAMVAFESGVDVAAAFNAAQEAVLAKQQADGRLSQMRTTLVLATMTNGVLNYGHMGDSRLYIFKQGKVALITPDHSVTQVLYKTGEITFKQIRHDENRNKVLRVIGEKASFNPQLAIKPWQLEAGDAILLCTDGWWEHVLENEMEKTLRKVNSPIDWLAQMKKRLLKRAQKGHDNYSAIAVMVE